MCVYIYIWLWDWIGLDRRKGKCEGGICMNRKRIMGIAEEMDRWQYCNKTELDLN